MYDVIILGGGPAGLTATMYCIRKRLDVLLITDSLGGKTNSYLEFPAAERHQVITGAEVVDRFSSEIEYLKFARIFDTADWVQTTNDGFAVHTQRGRAYQAHAIIVTTGARPQLLGIPGEEEFLGRGLGYSAVSYTPLFIDRKTAIIGDGDLAIRSAADMATHAKHVTLVAPTRGQLDSPLGKRLEQAPNVTILEGYQVQAVKGDHYARSLVVSRDGDEQEIAVDGIFVELELIPNSELVAHLVELDEQHRIKIDKLNRTSCPGMFAAGDVTDAFAEQVLIALGEGAKAALSAYEYLLEQGFITIGD